MLVAVNIFLLVLVVDRESKSARYEETAREQTITILADSNISLDRAILPEEMTLPPLAVTRDASAEASRAAALVGENAVLDAEALTYHGSKGSVKFYADGEFTASFSAGAYPIGTKSPAQAALDCLRLVGLEGMEKETVGGTVSVQLTYAGAPIFAPVSTPARDTVVTIQDGALRAIEGYRLTGVPTEEEGDAPLSVVTILLRFLSYIKASGDICNSIIGMNDGYTLASTQGGQAKLIPTWHITTDTGEYYMNAITGTVF